MALERVRGKRDKKARAQQNFLVRVARQGIKLFGAGALSAGTLGTEILDQVDTVVTEINKRIASEGIELSKKVIEFSDAVTDLAAEVSPIDKRVERVLDGVLDFPTEAYFRAWIFTLQFYLDSVEEAKEARKTKMKRAPPDPFRELTPEERRRQKGKTPPELGGARKGPQAEL